MLKESANKIIYISCDIKNITGDRERSEGMYPGLTTFYDLFRVS